MHRVRELYYELLRAKERRRLGACQVGEPVGKVESDVRRRGMGLGGDGLPELREEGAGRRLSLREDRQSIK